MPVLIINVAGADKILTLQLTFYNFTRNHRTDFQFSPSDYPFFGKLESKFIFLVKLDVLKHTQCEK